MNFNRHKKKTFGIIAGVLFTFAGTYNAVVINSDSSISSADLKFVKRLDEVYGVVTPGRMVAASVSWQKLPQPQSRPALAQLPSVIQSVSKSEAAPVAIESAKEAVAAVQEDLNLNLVEVINPTKFQQGLKAGDFNGNLVTNNGIIESLSVALPNGEGVSVSFSEMTGNVFEYDFNGELYSGMMYQVDQFSYMVTLTNGPLEGTRLRFSQSAPEQQQEETQNYLSENYGMNVGDFGSEMAPEVASQSFENPDQALQAQTMQSQGFNLDQSQAL
jgi:hypothetical protein